MNPVSKQLSRRQIPWASILLHGVTALILVVVGLVPGTGLPVAQAAGVLTITDLTGVYAIYDHNQPTTSPGVFMAEAKVCNTGNEELRDVTVYIGNGLTPGTFNSVTVGGVIYRLEMLDKFIGGDTDDATRSLGTLAAGTCVYVYWAIDYPTPNIDLSGTALPFTLWGQGKTPAGSTVSATPVNDTVILRSTISASANKIAVATPQYTVSPTGPYSIGQQVVVCYPSVDFGVIGNGDNKVNDFWYQPVGSNTFNPDVLRLVKTEATLQSSKCTGSHTYTNITYFSTIDDGDWDGDGTTEYCAGNSQQVTGQYCYTFVAIGPGSSDLTSYQQASSGNQQKYNGDYGITVLVTTNDTCTVSLAKSATPGNVVQGQELTYTSLFTNLTTTAVGAPPGTTLQILDAIPSNTRYKPGSASCTGGTIYYSTNGGTSYTSTEPTTVPSNVTNLKCVLNGALAGSGSGTLIYTVVAQDNNGVTAGPATSNFRGAQCSASQGVSTTPVTLSYFLASRSGETVRFEWSTATETANVGFNLYVMGPGGRQRVNPELIPSHVVDSVEPQDYVYEATGVEGVIFYIEDVDILGRPRQHGPFLLDVEYGGREEADPIDWPALQAEHDAQEAARESELQAQIQEQIDAIVEEPEPATAHGIFIPLVQGGSAEAPAAATAPEASASAAPTANYTPLPVADLLINQTGLYRLTYEALLDAGFDLAGAVPAHLALTRGGVSVPMEVYAQKRFGPGSYIQFYGEGLDTLYTDTSVYALHLDVTLASRVAVDETKPRGQAATFYMETATVEQEKAYSFAAPNGDPWYQKSMLVYTNPKSWTFELDVDGLVAGASPSTLAVGLWGGTDRPQAPDHHVVVQLNGETAADDVFDGVVDHPISVELPQGLLQEGSNSLVVTLPGDTGVSFEIVNLDRYSVTYPRAFLAREGRLAFKQAGEVFRVDGLPTQSVVVYRLDEAGPVRMNRVEVAGDNGVYSATFAGTQEPRTYLLFDEGTLLAPTIKPARPEADITSGLAQYLVISHPDFLEGLAPLVEARQAEGFAVRLVDVEDIYAQFSQGIFDPQAIQDYIRHATANMGAEYVLLVGGDTYDYRNYLGAGSLSFIPTLYAATDELITFAPVDPLFVDLDGDLLPDLPIGRFPVRNSAELVMMVGKTLGYASKDYGQTAIFASDGFDAAASVSFSYDSDRFIQRLPAGWSVQKAYLDLMSVPDARAALIQAMNEGVALTSFVGHSSLDRWTFDGLFFAGDVQALTNHGRPTVVAQWGCWNTYHVAPAYNTLGHKFLLSGDQGAVAVLGAATLTEAFHEELLGQRVMARLAQPGVTMGTAIQEAKAELAATQPGLSDVLLGWTLLGDPALMVEP